MKYKILFSAFIFLLHELIVLSKPVNLKCEYLVNPLGIDVQHPRLSWQMDDKSQGATQYSYQIFVDSDLERLMLDHGNMWETGEVVSDRMLVDYNGKELIPFTKYYWTVEIIDKDKNKSSSDFTATFETGMMNIQNWKGSWITDTVDFNYKPAPYFRKTFEIKKTLKSARAYIAVAGLYELYLNGKKAGNHRLDPMYTRFDRRTLYVTYDVTSLLKEGKNAIGVILGNGWYNHQARAVWDFDFAPWRQRPKFCMDLRITYNDGSVETVISDNTWKHSIGPIIRNNIYTGEHYNARLQQAGWNSPDFDDSKWKYSIFQSAPSQKIVAQIMQPIRDAEEIPALTMNKIDDKTYIFDLGRNFAGVSRITVDGEAGTTIHLKHAEKIDSTGRADQSNIIGLYRPLDDLEPYQTDIIILNGKGPLTFMPLFNYKGFRYVEVKSDKPITLTKESLTGIFMHSDVTPAGSIGFSNALMNKLNNAVKASYLSNMFGYFTDCPQREKNGWTGDAHTAVETGLYYFDGITVYEKWLADHRDAQEPNGTLPAIIPSDGWGLQWANGVDWTSSLVIIPWNIYLFYGDSQLLEKCYDNIKRYIDYIDANYPSGITDWGLGDWVPVKSEASVELTTTAYYYTDALILSKAAKLFGRHSDYNKYSVLAEKIKNAFNAKYFNKDKNIYGSGCQTEMSIALFRGLVPDEFMQKVTSQLAKRVNEDNNHVDVGLLGTKSILNALSENGYPDLAYTLASQETYPSWGYWIANGATTLYESWKIGKDVASMNHIMFGEIGAWFYKALGGIYPDESKPGFKKIILKPNFVKALNHFEAKHDSPYGTIISSWKKSGYKILYEVTIPANSSGILSIAAKKITEKTAKINISNNNSTLQNIPLEAGSYSFIIEQ